MVASAAAVVVSVQALENASVFNHKQKKKRYGPRPDGTSFLWRFVELEAMLLRAKHDAQIYILIYTHTCTRMSRLNTWTRTRIIYNT